MAEQHVRTRHKTKERNVKLTSFTHRSAGDATGISHDDGDAQTVVVRRTCG
jgi:hypothetical protein